MISRRGSELTIANHLIDDVFHLFNHETICVLKIVNCKVLDHVIFKMIQFMNIEALYLDKCVITDSNTIFSKLNIKSIIISNFGGFEKLSNSLMNALLNENVSFLCFEKFYLELNNQNFNLCNLESLIIEKHSSPMNKTIFKILENTSSNTHLVININYGLNFYNNEFEKLVDIMESKIATNNKILIHFFVDSKNMLDKYTKSFKNKIPNPFSINKSRLYDLFNQFAGNEYTPARTIGLVALLRVKLNLPKDIIDIIMSFVKNEQSNELYPLF
jgi:hypothetical protein